VVRRLGKPVSDQWRSDTGELQYQVMRYPERGLFIILMGKDRPSARYIGALDKQWKPVHSVDLPNAGTPGRCCCRSSDSEVATKKTLERVLSKAGIGSRTEARSWIGTGRVNVNGKLVQTPDVWVDASATW